MADATWDVFSNTGSDVAQAFVKSTAFGTALDSVEARARAGVIDETKKNAITLMLLALAGGAVGGYLFKGKVGLMAAGLVGAWAVSQLAGGGQPAPQPVSGLGYHGVGYWRR